MKISQIRINNIGGIKQAEINFKSGMNVVCGYNGVGKTTILNCIAHSFAYSVGSDVLSRNANSENGNVSAHLYEDDVNGYFARDKRTNFNVKHFNPDESEHLSPGNESDISLNIINLGVDRFLKYTKVKSIPSDSVYSRYTVDNNIINGSTTTDFKSWFLNRFLYSKHEGSLEDFQIKNMQFAIDCFSILDKDFSFSRVMASSNEVMINTPSGEIFFEYLSSGFKSCLSILFSIIKEVEFCSKDKRKVASDFDGVILIDEPEIHLHPSWQYKIKSILTTAFPKAQFICASHSPYVVQSCSSGEVITLVNKKGVVTVCDQLSDSTYGFQGWTIEEVLDDVMGMPDARTKLYKSKVDDFYNSISKNEKKVAREIFNDLDSMLHPNSIDRKIFKLDLAMLTGGERDQAVKGD